MRTIIYFVWPYVNGCIYSRFYGSSIPMLWVTMCSLISPVQDTCTGFLLGGIGDINNKRQENYLVVTKGGCGWNVLRSEVSVWYNHTESLDCKIWNNLLWLLKQYQLVCSFHCLRFWSKSTVLWGKQNIIILAIVVTRLIHGCSLCGLCVKIVRFCSCLVITSIACSHKVSLVLTIIKAPRVLMPRWRHWSYTTWLP